MMADSVLSGTLCGLAEIGTRHYGALRQIHNIF